MGACRVAIRILGVAATAHGFAFANTEGTDRLLDWGSRSRSSYESVYAELDAIITRGRPLFVACEVARNWERSERAHSFNEALIFVCARHDIMILAVERRSLDYQGRGQRPATNHDIAQGAAARFPLIADKLPRRRKLWEGSDDRIGILLAAAAAGAGWNHFRPTRQVER